MFTYLDQLEEVGGKYEIVMGDARLSLESEPPQEFDLLVVDAFSGDAIPIHLLTREAAALYMQHIKKDGILAIHASNRFLDLPRVVRDMAKFHELDYARVLTRERAEDWLRASEWILLTRAGYFRSQAALEFVSAERIPEPMTTWTDDRNSLVELLEW
jgi:hypothetical protein